MIPVSQCSTDKANISHIGICLVVRPYTLINEHTVDIKFDVVVDVLLKT